MIYENKTSDEHPKEKLNFRKIQISKILQCVPKNQNDERGKIGEHITNDNNREHQGHPGHHPLLPVRHGS